MDLPHACVAFTKPFLSHESSLEEIKTHKEALENVFLQNNLQEKLIAGFTKL